MDRALTTSLVMAVVWYSFGCQSAGQEDSLERVDNRLLPSGRSIAPAGDVVSFFGRPVDLEIGNQGKTLFVKDRNHVRAIDCETFQIVTSIELKEGASLHGMVCDSEGNIYASNSKHQVYAYRFEDDSLSLKKELILPEGSYPCGLDLSADQRQLFVCLSKRNSVAIVDLESGKMRSEIPVGVAPFDCHRVGEKLVVSNIGGRRANANDQTAPSAKTDTVVDERGIASTGTITIVSLTERNVASVATGLHPTVLASKQKQVVVCNSNDDTFSLIDLADNKSKSVNVKPNDRLPFGSMPSSAIWIDDQRLAVCLAGNNAVTILEKNAAKKFRLLGLVPTAWYPVSVARSNRYLFIASAKGFGARSKRRDEKEGWNSHDHNGVIQRVALKDLQNSERLREWSSQVEKNSRFPQILRNQLLAKSNSEVAAKPIPAKLGQPSLIKHVIYVIKENRTFDQVFGDYPKARSDPRLCIFPREKTPNHHALADRFGILDNYYCNGVLSADGHSWATEGNVTTYLERAFGGFSRSYTFGDDPITYSSSGFVWDHILAAGLSFRNYGEMNYAKTPGDIKYHEVYRRFEAGEKLKFQQNIGIERLRKYSCRDYPGWNMDIPDVLRINRFLKEFRTFEKNGNLPNFCIVYLPQDHLGAEGVASDAHMADNDLALGRLVEAVSRSRFWKDTVIFVNEDDPQNGFDHVDGHRSICLVISPYSRPGVNSLFYNQTSVLRTMLHIFGLPPMNQQDASAPLMNECFHQVANLEPYQAIQTATKLNEPSTDQSSWSPAERKWRALLATVPIERTGMKTEQDEENLNRFIWHEAKGWLTPYPAEFAGAHGKGLRPLGLILDANPSKED